MRSFPNVEDNIVHEIIIATDGCRTSDAYMLKKGVDTIKKRGIKVRVKFWCFDNLNVCCKNTFNSLFPNLEQFVGVYANFS